MGPIFLKQGGRKSIFTWASVENGYETYTIYLFWVEPEGAWAPMGPYWFVPEWIFNILFFIYL